MKTKKQNKIVFYVIKGSTLKKFIVIDLITGTGIYYVLKAISASVIIATIGSFIGPEGIKKHNKSNKIIKVEWRRKDISCISAVQYGSDET